MKTRRTDKPHNKSCFDSNVMLRLAEDGFPIASKTTVKNRFFDKLRGSISPESSYYFQDFKFVVHTATTHN